MTDNDPIAPTIPSGPSWRFIAASAAGSLVVHLLVATAIYVEFAHPALPAGDAPTVEVALVSPDQLPKAPDVVEPPKPEVKVEPPKPPEPPPPPPKQEAEKPKPPPPFKADPSQVVPATRDKATPPQGNQAEPTNAKRQSENPDKPNTETADKAAPTPDPDQAKPEEPKQAEVKPPEDPKPADPNGVLPKQEPPKPTSQKQATVQPAKPPPSKVDGAGARKVMAPVVVRPDRFNGRAGNSDQPSYPSSARANGLQGRVVLDALVTGDGTIRRINIIKSSGHDELDESAVRAVWLWRFHATGPIPPQGQWIEIPVDFRLN